MQILLMLFTADLSQIKGQRKPESTLLLPISLKRHLKLNLSRFQVVFVYLACRL